MSLFEDKDVIVYPRVPEEYRINVTEDHYFMLSTNRCIRDWINKLYIVQPIEQYHYYEMTKLGIEEYVKGNMDQYIKVIYAIIYAGKYLRRIYFRPGESPAMSCVTPNSDNECKGALCNERLERISKKDLTRLIKIYLCARVYYKGDRYFIPFYTSAKEVKKFLGIDPDQKILINGYACKDHHCIGGAYNYITYFFCKNHGITYD